MVRSGETMAFVSKAGEKQQKMALRLNFTVCERVRGTALEVELLDWYMAPGPAPPALVRIGDVVTDWIEGEEDYPWML